MLIRILMILPIIVFSLNAKEKGYFDLHEKGWHWYQKMPEPRVQKEKNKDKKEEASNAQQSVSQNPIEELKEYQQKLEEAKAQAVMHPNKENIEKYQYLQYEALERADKFSSIWMENVYKNPELNYSLKSPTSQNARHVYLREKEKEKKEKIESLSEEYGLFFFFKNDCAYCEMFAPIVRQFSEKYNWEVLAISEFGETNKLFERNVKDNGLADTWGVSTYPSLFAVNPKTGDVIPIANGMISIEEMEDRIMTVTKGDENNDA